MNRLPEIVIFLLWIEILGDFLLAYESKMIHLSLYSHLNKSMFHQLS